MAHQWVFFNSLIGLRQGQPPFASTLSLNDGGLEADVAQDRGIGYISGLNVGVGINRGLQISHLLFADDTILFYDTKREQLLYVWMELTCFEAVTWLKVNLNKSEVVMVGELGAWRSWLILSTEKSRVCQRITRACLWAHPLRLRQRRIPL